VKTNIQSRFRALLGMLATGTALSTAFVAPGFAQEFETTTPIRHVVVIFQENSSFDHYFGTYPTAANPPGEPPFTAFAATPTVNGLSANQPTSSFLNPPDTGALFTNNLNPVAPFLLQRVNAVTCDQDHGYGDEQQAVDAGMLDHFALPSGAGGTSATGVGCQDAKGNNLPGFAMGYFDGNTVTAMWNYAQFFSMSDNSFDTTFGPSTPGAINLISGQTHGVLPGPGVTPASISFALAAGPNGDFTLVSDVDSALDDCGSPTSNIMFTDPNFKHTNVGDLLNAQGITWGWFGGGFRPTTPATATARAVCAAAHPLHQFAPIPPGATAAQVGGMKADYNAHHTPFQYYTSTSNPHHLPPTSTAAIGFTDQANHNYDLQDFFTALSAGNMPAVSYLKAENYRDGHPGAESDPIDEQNFIVNTINTIQQSPFWQDTAIIIAWDDSDGWYDHVTGPIVNASAVAGFDSLNGKSCGTPSATGFVGRCGYGARLPLLVISPWAKQNYVDHNLTDLTSILRFIEENWNLGFIDGPTAPPKGQASFDRIAGQINGMFDFDNRPRPEAVILDPTTGVVVR
jgi:phospholipase C